MYLTSTGLGINQSSPTVKLQITDTSATILRTEATANDGDALIQADGRDSSGNLRRIMMRTDAGADQYRIISSDTSYNLALCTGNAPRVLIAGNSAATSIGGSNVFNAMLTVQGDLSGAIFQLKAAENTNRLMVSGLDTSDCEVNLYDKNGGQRGILVGGETEFAIKAPNNSAPLTFYTHNGSSIGERLRIQSNGRVNIGVNPQVGAQSLLNLKGSGDDGNQTVLLRLGNDSSGAGTGAAIVMGAGAGASSQGATIAGFYDGTGTSFTVGTNASFNGSTTERFRIHSTGQVTKPASCAFNVTPNGNQSLGSGETLTSWKTTDSRGFENTTTGGYFGSGIFTAPVTGAYYFTSNILLYDTNGTNSIHLYWQKNGSGTHTYWNTRFNSGDFGYQNYMPVAGACTMYMSAGDTCRIRISFSGSNCGMYGNDQNWGNWGGFLIG